MVSHIRYISTLRCVGFYTMLSFTMLEHVCSNKNNHSYFFYINVIILYILVCLRKYYKPGAVERKVIAVKSTGHPPLSAIVEWKYETNLFNPFSWRLVKSPSIYIEYLKISSLEYNTV